MTVYKNESRKEINYPYNAQTINCGLFHTMYSLFETFMDVIDFNPSKELVRCIEHSSTQYNGVEFEFFPKLLTNKFCITESKLHCKLTKTLNDLYHLQVYSPSDYCEPFIKVNNILDITVTSQSVTINYTLFEDVNKIKTLLKLIQCYANYCVTFKSDEVDYVDFEKDLIDFNLTKQDLDEFMKEFNISSFCK